ncbi:hypothetical protein Tco_0262236 [Tanacetum coccineum]
MVPAKITPTPSTTPPTTEAQVKPTSVSDPPPIVFLRLSELEKKLKHCLDESIASGEVNPDKVLTKRRHDDDQDPSAGFGKEKKKRRKRKDSEPSKDKDQSGSSFNVHEVAMKADESREVEDDVENVEEQPQDDAAPKKENSVWFKQDPKPKTPDPNWQKEPKANDAPK